MALTQADLNSIKGVVETVVNPQFAEIDRQFIDVHHQLSQVRRDIEDLAANTAEQFNAVPSLSAIPPTHHNPPVCQLYQT